MIRVEIASRLNAFFVRVFGCFGAAAIVLGTLIVLVAHKIAVAQPTVSETGVRIVGLAGVALGAWMLAWTVRQLAAICEIAIDDDGGWTLRTRSGKQLAAPAGDATLELRSRTVWVFYNQIPRRLNVCDGWLVIAGQRWRLAKIAPSAYDDVLGKLGLPGPAPRNGTAHYVVRRAA